MLVSRCRWLSVPSVLLEREQAGNYALVWLCPLADMTSSSTYKFLSVFKWEFRKGWDVLLSAFLTEFTADDDVRTACEGDTGVRGGVCLTA